MFHTSQRGHSQCTGSSVLFFFQAEDGIRDTSVTGVQTCALPISLVESFRRLHRIGGFSLDRRVGFDETFDLCFQIIGADGGKREKEQQRDWETTHLNYRVKRVAFFAAWRSSASSMRRSISLGIGRPLCSHILGYMLIEVKPGMVLISLM